MFLECKRKIGITVVARRPFAIDEIAIRYENVGHVDAAERHAIVGAEQTHRRPAVLGHADRLAVEVALGVAHPAALGQRRRYTLLRFQH